MTPYDVKQWGQHPLKRKAIVWTNGDLFIVCSLWKNSMVFES